MEKPFPAYSGDEPYIFVCYAHGDVGVVYPEIRRLHESGINLWYDEGISAGKVWRAEIAEAIQGCSKFLYYISAASLSSEHCNREVDYALDKGFDIVPVYLEEADLTPELDLALNRVQALHREDDLNYQQHLLQALGKSPSPAIDSGQRLEPAPVPSNIRRPLVLSLAITTLIGIAVLGWYLLRVEIPAPASMASSIRSIAVLPLENLSGDPDQEYVADGMTEELISELAKLGSLNVISRTSVMRYKKREKSIPEIAAELGIDGAIEGTVTREEDRFRVTVQLIDARTDTHLWAGQFDRELSSVLALRSDVARAVVEQIRLELTPEEDMALTSSRRVNPLAFDAYLRGRQITATSQWGRATTAQALEHYERAVALDPEFAEAWAEVAGMSGLLDQREKAREAAERAFALDPRLGVAHAALYWARVWSLDFAGERHAAERAVQLSPNDSRALNAYSASLSLRGQLEEALRVSERIPLVAPLDRGARSIHVMGLYFTRHYERTLEEAERARQLFPDFSDSMESLAYVKLGRVREAHYLNLARFKPSDPSREARERGWAESGLAGAWRAAIDELAKTPAAAWTIALLYADLGETDKSLAWLERGYEDHSFGMFLTSGAPSFDPIRSDPRFDDLMRRMGFPDNESPAMLADVGQVLALKGRSDEAIANLEKALQLAPEASGLPRWRYYMAMAHFAGKSYELSATWAQRALKDEASSYSLAFAHLLIASSNAYLGRLDDARESLTQALRLWPDVAIKWDLWGIFMAGDPALRDRYLDGLRMAGMEG